MSILIRYRIVFTVRPATTTPHSLMPGRSNFEPDIEDKHRKWLHSKLHKQVRVEDRCYIIRTKSETLEQIDKPRSTGYKALVTHPSESGWNLPIDNRHHFSKFPQEIKDAIFGFALTVSPNINPCTVRSNWRSNYCEPHYEVLGGNDVDHSSIAWIVG
jgi:hypothetical protein